ncbi:FAD-dependent thymidylate synthase [Altererythrobacter sp. MF3-039]|uniref:FAD-dependent thymidylate synthase n=1 Tax=Altererythrobacter sp. MF3-039 TaxID=3252901 RepID=UPI00390C99BF
MHPKIIILSRPVATGNEAQFLKAHGFEWQPTGQSTDAERIIEFSGRLCYLSFDPNKHTQVENAEYIRKLIQHGHESVLEHAQWTFLIDGVTRGFSHQLVRHRVGFSFSQLSQQYHDESEAVLLRPDGLEDHSELSNEWKTIEAQINNFYKRALKTAPPTNDFSDRERTRYVRSFARSLLPNATRTILSVTANARSLRHFLALRGALEGDIEMRRVSELIYDMLRIEAPAVMFDFEKKALGDGSPLIVRSAGAGPALP